MERFKTRILFLPLLIGFLLLPAAEVQSKKYMRCQLARELLEKYKINKTFLSNWICLVEHESYMDTRARKEYPNGHANYGLFQISSKEWCKQNQKGGHCNKKCEDFLDDNIADDVACAQMIFNREGFKYWRGWNNSCSNSQNLPNLGVVCNLRGVSPSRPFERLTNQVLYPASPVGLRRFLKNVELSSLNNSNEELN